MIAEEGLTFLQSILIVSIPAFIAALASVVGVALTTRNKKEIDTKISTGNGKDIGPTVKDMAEDIHRMSIAIERLERR